MKLGIGGLTMTDEQWKQVEKNISGIYFSIHLKIDGYDITLQPVKNGNLKFMIAVYVNGHIKGEWIINDCEIRKKFYRSISKCYFTKKGIEKITKGLRKKEREEYEKELKEKYTYTYHEPYFGSFKTLKSTLIKNNTSIELVEIE